MFGMGVNLDIIILRLNFAECSLVNIISKEQRRVVIGLRCLYVLNNREEAFDRLLIFLSNFASQVITTSLYFTWPISITLLGVHQLPPLVHNNYAWSLSFQGGGYWWP